MIVIMNSFASLNDYQEGQKLYNSSFSLPFVGSIDIEKYDFSLEIFIW